MKSIRKVISVEKPVGVEDGSLGAAGTNRFRAGDCVVTGGRGGAEGAGVVKSLPIR